MERIGIYGGTFNPPHLGHIQAAACAVDALQLDKLLLIPDRIAPHKELPAGSPSPAQRLEMVRIAAQEAKETRFAVSSMELERPGPSYSYLTVEELRRQNPDAELYLLMGTDMFLSFYSWRNATQILENVTLGVFYRGDKEEIDRIRLQKETMEAHGAKVVLVENPVIPISSTQLRRMLIFRCAQPFLSPGVGHYIEENGLYDTAQPYEQIPMDQLEKAVVGLMKKDRIAHVLGCRDMAEELAKHWGADPVDAGRAGLLHDIAKALEPPLQLTLCGEYGILLDNFYAKNPQTLHALTGSLVAKRIFGENEAVVSAIRYHTTGRADMTLLEKIIYIADYVERNRTFPGVEALRAMAFTDLDTAVMQGLEMTVSRLKEQGREISPESLEALEYFQKTL